MQDKFSSSLLDKINKEEKIQLIINVIFRGPGGGPGGSLARRGAAEEEWVTKKKVEEEEQDTLPPLVHNFKTINHNNDYAHNKVLTIRN